MRGVVLGGTGHFTGVEDAEDVRMLKAGREFHLSLEPFGADRRGDVFVEHFERHRPVMTKVVRQKDDGESPSPELTLDAISVLKAGFERAPGGQRRVRCDATSYGERLASSSAMTWKLHALGVRTSAHRRSNTRRRSRRQMHPLHEAAYLRIGSI